MDPRIPELIYIDELIVAGGDARAFRRAARAGHYVRIRRGIYSTRADWEEADERSRHRARTRAVFSQLRSPVRALAAGYSAAAVHGLEVLHRWPEYVTLLVPYRGGGTAEPGVVRTAARWHDDHAGIADGVPATRIERTVFDLVLLDGFAGGVAAIDSAVRAGRTSVTALAEFLAAWNPSAGAARCSTALDFVDAASGSFGESMARAAIHALGFPAPQLQAEFVDSEGAMFVDFFWPEFGVVAEFDGKTKYTREEFTRGDPAEVVWREKQREDRLRRQVRTVVRITWDVVRDARRLAAALESAGITRRGHLYVRPDTGARVSFGR